MAKIIVDQENAAESFWDAFSDGADITIQAHRHADDHSMPAIVERIPFPAFAEPLNDCSVTEIECTAEQADAFVAYASRLPGWADGPAYAKHPVIVQK